MKGREDAQDAGPDEAETAWARTSLRADKPTGGLEPPTGGHHHEAAIKASADAELTPPAQIGLPLTGGDGEYPGPFAYRQGKPMRPDVALAFDRLDATARHDGVALIIVSAVRSNAEQARLFAAHPDPTAVTQESRSARCSVHDGGFAPSI
jgi:LAS superfamily LD-carboxypeptidase LdcB